MKKIKRCIVRGFRELIHMRKIHSWLVAFVLSFMNFKACGTLTNNGAVYAILVIIGQGFLLYLFGHINIFIEEKIHENYVEWREKSAEILEPIRTHLPENINCDGSAVNYIVAALDNAQNANNVPKLFNPQREREHRDCLFDQLTHEERQGLEKKVKNLIFFDPRFSGYSSSLLEIAQLSMYAEKCMETSSILIGNLGTNQSFYWVKDEDLK